MKEERYILPYKALSRLPQEGGFYSGVCPGAAAITINLSFFSSLRGTLGRRTEVGSRKTEVGSQLVPHFLFLIPYFLFSSFVNIEHRITFTGLAANPDGAASSVRVGTPKKPETISIEGRNIPVLRTSGLNHIPFATKVVGALHLGFQTAVTAISETTTPQNTLLDNQLVCRTIIGETAAAPRNTLSDNRRICRNEYSSSGKKVRSTEILKENNEYRIFNTQYSTMNQNPLAEIPSDRVIRAGRNPKSRPTVSSGRAGTQNPELETRNFEPSGTKYKDAPLLPRGGFNSGDSPGAAAITILQVLFSSPRVSPNFAGARCYALSGLEPLSAYLPTNLPVKNRPETGVFPWYSHPAGRYSVQGTSTHPERPLQRTKPERRYAYVLN